MTQLLFLYFYCGLLFKIFKQRKRESLNAAQVGGIENSVCMSSKSLTQNLTPFLRTTAPSDHQLGAA